MMLSMMISDPKQPRNDIHVYLNPVVEDLKLLWVDGIEVFDVVASETFMMHAMLFCTINHFPAYGNLSGYNIKGHKACPIYEENTTSHQLRNRRETVYLCHRRLLQVNHLYRRLNKAFNGHQENDKAPTLLSAIQIHEKVNKYIMYLVKRLRSHLHRALGRKNQYSLIFHIGRSYKLGIA